jgi:hypothetical protein
MAERSFEMELDRMFGEHAAFADAAAFAHSVEARLDRDWTWRRVLIGGLGLAGGLFGAIQMLGSGMGQRLAAIAKQSAPDISVQWTDVAVSHLLPGGFQVNGEILWMSAIMALAALALAITRAVRDI